MYEAGIRYMNSPERRGFDTVVSACALGVLAVPACAIAVGVASEYGTSEIFYRQKRMWPGQAESEITKFQTLPPGTVYDPASELCVDDNRTSEFSNLLRSTGLDEIPQFLPVLFGSMTIFGFRGPLLERALEERQKADRVLFEEWYGVAPHIKPALAGPGGLTKRSVTRTDELNLDLVAHVMRQDLRYIEKVCLSLDIQLLLKTPYVLGRAGINQIKRYVKEHN